MCVQGNLETFVEFLPRHRRPGLSLDHWLRPRPAKTDHFFAGVNTRRCTRRNRHSSRHSGRNSRSLEPRGRICHRAGEVRLLPDLRVGRRRTRASRREGPASRGRRPPETSRRTRHYGWRSTASWFPCRKELPKIRVSSFSTSCRKTNTKRFCLCPCCAEAVSWVSSTCNTVNTTSAAIANEASTLPEKGQRTVLVTATTIKSQHP